MSGKSSEVERWLTRGDASLVRQFVGQVSRQTSSRRVALDVLRRWETARPLRVIDLGCGTGSSRELLGASGASFHWVGVDIPESPEVSQRTRRDLAFVVFDGDHLPFKDCSADLLYSHQVLEHVRHPEALMNEAARVLSPQGWFVGSTSQLEPFHSRSTFNYTPYGLTQILRTAGFTEIELRPGIDGLTLIVRRLFMFVKLAWLFEMFFEHESPLNAFIEMVGFLARLNPQTRALLKLVFAGQFVFVARRAAEPHGSIR